MSYQVLARKWRPHTFTEVVGQQHVLRPLISALETNRLHHAYLFTGTRGVGKTTIARILAKSLNCEEGVTATPCGKCSACEEIDSGRFVDLLEIDAASRTKVEDTRELLDNVQYRPTRGRYKVYLIDEVHMLSRHSFNALLKTLEEPPEHVKFLLATTDPQKLPITVLSRCLQFNLKALNRDEIAGHLERVLAAEDIPFDRSALPALARAAQGSLRDALSLTDQAIAQGEQQVTQASVQAMLGNVPSLDIAVLLQAIIRGQGQQMLAKLDEIALQVPDLSALLAELQHCLHQLALIQVVPESASALDVSEAEQALAQQLPAELVQVFYDVVVAGRRDLAYAADVRSGVEMTLLRLLAFRPEYLDVVETPASTAVKERHITTETAEPAGDQAVAEAESTPELKTESKIVSTQANQSENRQSAAASNVTDASLGAEIDDDQFEPDDRDDDLQLHQDLQQEYAAIAEQAEGLRPAPRAELTPAAEQTSSPSANESLASIMATRQSLMEKKKPTAEAVKPAERTFNRAPTAELTATPIVEPEHKPEPEHEPESEHQPDLKSEPESESEIVPVAVDEASNVTQDVAQNVAPGAASEDSSLPVLENLQPGVKLAADMDSWSAIVDALELTGLTKQLALNMVLEQPTKHHYVLKLRQQQAHLLTEATQSNLLAALQDFAPAAEVEIQVEDAPDATPTELQQQINTARLAEATKSLREDANVQLIQQLFDAEFVESSIKLH